MIYGETQITSIFKSSLRFGKKIALVCAALKLNERNRKGKTGNRRNPRNFFRNRGYAIEEMDRLNDATFKKMFRLDRPSFEFLLQQIIVFPYRL